MTKEERMKEILRASPNFGKRVGYKMCVVDELHDMKELIKETKELKAQIEKMKCCYNCSKWYDGECEESPKSITFFWADFKCEKWELAND